MGLAIWRVITRTDKCGAIFIHVVIDTCSLYIVHVQIRVSYRGGVPWDPPRNFMSSSCGDSVELARANAVLAVHCNYFIQNRLLALYEHFIHVC